MSAEGDRQAAADRLHRVEELYHHMLARPAAERDAALAAACPNDPALVAEVLSLLKEPSSGAGLFGTPAVEAAVRDLSDRGHSFLGRRIGVFEVQGLLSQGGMGEVYRARDTKLGRDVAIKILPRAFRDDADRVARFEREARVLASLNHPNIAAVYGLEDAGDQKALVMELVDGEDLSVCLSRGAIPVTVALPIAKQIAEAIESAHERGIIHRDLKPANIKVRPDGTVKLLDFGLAKAVIASWGAPGQDPTESPTMTARATRAGMILGTAAYMAPEQALGKEVDRRADIWSFGAVLFEMLTGERAFKGDDVASTLAAVLRDTPPLGALPKSVPPRIAMLLQRCLVKDPGARLRDIGDAALELRDPPPAERLLRPASREARGWVALGVAALALIALLASLRSSPPPVRVAKLEIPLPSGGTQAAISPDGSQVAYQIRGELWVRQLTELNAVKLPGTERASHPFWSADGRWVGFFSDGKLTKIRAAGGPPVRLSRGTNTRGSGAWNREGTILFSEEGPLQRISEAGGEATPATELDASRGETHHLHPSFLPDGRRFLFLAWSANAASGRVYIGSLDSKARTPLMDVASKAIYAPPGFVLFGRAGSLVARPFDARQLRFTGDEMSVAEGFALAGLGYAPFSASDDGTLVYKEGGATIDFPLMWADRNGKTSEPLAAIPSAQLRLSPDGHRLAFPDQLTLGTIGADIGVLDLEDGKRMRLTNDPSTNHFPVWSPDGSRVVFDSNRGRDAQFHALYETSANGATPARLLLEPPPGLSYSAQDWSRDGTLIVFLRGRPKDRTYDIGYLPLEGDRKPVPYLTTPFDEENAVLSPNGRWLAYVTNESGSFQVVVRSFPDPSQEKRQISVGGGASPRWRADGRELFYLDPDGAVMAVEISTDRGLRIGAPRPLFRTSFRFSAATDTETPWGSSYPYDVAPGGEKFVISGGLIVRPLHVVMNWVAGLKRP